MKRHADRAHHDGAGPATTKTITNNAFLCEVVARFQKAAFLAVDTEFMRERTYYPQLCLVQLSDGDEAGGDRPAGKRP